MPTSADIFYVFVTLLAMINPIEAAAAFATLTGGRTRQERASIALRATIVGGVALIAFAFVGDGLLDALGVSMSAFRIAGGLLLLKVGFNMVFAEKTDRQTADAAKATSPPQSDPSVFPLGIPIITGPGALTVSVALVNLNSGKGPFDAIVFVGVTIVVFAITYLFMRGAEQLTKWFGQTGVDAMGRIAGIIVSAIAVQLVLNGLIEVLHGAMKG